ncbi:hypothetical protein ACTVJH_13375 [Desulfoplanes sp. PS50]
MVDKVNRGSAVTPINAVNLVDPGNTATGRTLLPLRVHRSAPANDMTRRDTGLAAYRE